MPYTNDPTNSPADQVRFLVGDTDTASPELTDAEVDFLLEEENGDARRAAARAAEALAAKFAGVSEDLQVGPLRVRSATGTDKAKKYTALARQLWARVAKTSGKPFAGGISQADKEARASDSDRVHPTFAKDMMEYPVSESTRVATAQDTAL